MDINDYLIEQEDKDWSTLLESWFWKLPETFNIWMVTKLGDLILVLEDEQIYFFDVTFGAIDVIAADQEDFVEKVNQDNNFEIWFGVTMVNECESAGKQLASDQCYGYQKSPVLGGELAASNLRPTPLVLHYSLHGQIHEQTQDVPEGESVQLEIVPPEGFEFDGFESFQNGS